MPCVWDNDEKVVNAVVGIHGVENLIVQRTVVIF